MPIPATASMSSASADRNATAVRGMVSSIVREEHSEYSGGKYKILNAARSTLPPLSTFPLPVSPANLNPL